MTVDTSKINYEILPVKDVSDCFVDDTKKWFEKKACDNDLTWLLVHADDGVIWGKIIDGKLQLSCGIQGPELRAMTIQTAYLFGETGELFLWKTDDMDWKARLLKEGAGKEIEYYDEYHLMWGDTVEKKERGFILLSQGSEGLRHALPLETTKNSICYPRLKVRHFLDYDPDGQAYIKFSRLVSIDSETEGQ